MTIGRVAIVGGSVAGLAVAETLREKGFDGAICIVGADIRPCYDRPPLSKRIFRDETELAAISLYDPARLRELELDIKLGVAATSVDLAGRKVALASGEEVAFDELVIATGVAPIPVQGGMTLRDAQDALRLGEELARAKRVVVIGAGVLGCEIAALCVGQGKRTTMLDRLPGPMTDRVGPMVAARIEAMHAARGVEMLFGVSVKAIEGNSAKRVVLEDGRALEADLVVVAVGARPATEWLRGSGIPLKNGILCDAHCRAAPGVHAAGDVANWFNPRFGRHMRIEHRMNATEQGIAVAADILGEREEFAPIPYFWTDQYDSKLQVHGLIGSDAETFVLAGDLESDNFLIGYRRNGRIEGILGCNMPGPVRKSRSLIGNATEPMAL
jgi:3-phenylpropionate/trans-cinnamate dioxygenase ferredoxin reductase component